MNARSRFSLSKRTHRMWPHQNDRNKKEVFLAHSAQLAVQSLPEGLILSQTSAFRLPPPFWNHGPIINICQYIDQVRTCLKWCPTTGASLFRIISPVISGNPLLLGSLKWFWKSVVDYQTLYICIVFFFFFFLYLISVIPILCWSLE